MKKILGLSIAALLVIGLVGGGTWAYFSDTETSTGNSFAVGTLDLVVNSENPLSSVLIDGSSVSLAPGDSLSQVSIPCLNDGDLTGDLHVRITSVTPSGGTAVYPSGDPKCSNEPEYYAEGGPGSWVAVDDIDTVMTLDADENGGSGITGLDGQTISSVEDTWVKVKDDLAGGETFTLDLGATLSDSTTNEYQGDTVTFTLEFALTQVDETP